MTLYHSSYLTPLLVSALAFAAMVPKAATAEDQTWAIIASPSVRELGIADLLTARLTNLEGVSLVERDEQAVAQNELELAALYQSTSARQRIELGKRVASQMLIVLDLTTVQQVDTQAAAASRNNNRRGTNRRGTEFEDDDLPVSEVQVLRVLICHCATGVRVARQSINLPTTPTETVVDELQKTVTRAQTKLQNGLKYIVGLSPPIAKGVRQYDRQLQASVGELIESALFAQQGVAVIELEEAQAILEELSESADSALERAVPVLLSPELIPPTGAHANQQVPAVRLVAKFHDGSTKQQLVEVDSPSKLATALTKPILSLLDGLPDGSNAEANAEFQRSWLIEQADNCTRLGEWKAAIDLRHAALLIDGEDTRQRTELLLDERLLLRHLATTPAVYAPWPGKPNTVDRAVAILDIYYDQLAQQEFLIRNAKVDAMEARRMITSQGYAAYQSGLRKQEVEANPEITTLLEQAEARRKQHLMAIAAPLFQLPLPEDHEQGYKRRALRADLQDGLLRLVHRRIDFKDPQIKDVEAMAQIWMTAVPDGLTYSSPLSSITYQLFPEARDIQEKSRYHQRTYQERSITAEQWEALLMTMSNVDHTSMRLAARAELLKWRWHLIDANTPLEEIKLLHDFALATQCELEAFPVKDNRGRSYWGGGGDPKVAIKSLTWLLYRFSIMPDPFGPRRQLTASPAPQKPRATKQGRRDNFVLNLTPLELTLAEQDTALPNPDGRHRFVWRGFNYGGPRRNDGPHWLACGDELDVLWSSQAVLYIAQPGTVERLTIDGKLLTDVNDIRFDGQRIWMATGNGEILVFDQRLQLTHRIDSKAGLPGGEHNLLVQPLGGGRAMATGSFGNPLRSWCAIIDLSEADTKIHLFHEAREVERREFALGPGKRSLEDRAKLGFVPMFIIQAPYARTAGDTIDDAVCIGIARSPNNRCDALLFVDVDTLQVTAATSDRVFGYARQNALYDHSQFTVMDGKVYHSSAFDHLLADLGVTGRWQNQLRPAGNRWPSFIQLGSHLHLPFADAWYLIDPAEETAENLLPDRIRQQLAIEPSTFVRSAHYGLVGIGNTGRMYQVEMKGDRPALNLSTPPSQASTDGQPSQSAPAQLQASAASNQVAKVTPAELDTMRSHIEQLTGRGIELPAEHLSIYKSGYGSLDCLMPRISSHDAYLDPPVKKDGYRYDFVDGRLVQITSVETDLPHTEIYYDDSGLPMLVVTFYTDQRTNKHRPTRYKWASFDEQQRLQRVVEFNDEMSVASIYVLETEGNYLSRDQLTYSPDGVLRRRSSSQPPVDQDGQPLTSAELARAAYSPLQQKLLEPTRIGLQPYYPMSGSIAGE